MVELPFSHVSTVFPQPTGTIPGRCRTPDEDIAKWCGQTSTVLVTIDKDFQTRWVRSGLLAAHGVEVIVFTKDLKGLDEQHARITRHYPHWQTELQRQPYTHRVWMQNQKLNPTKIIGKQARRRSRTPAPTVTAQPVERPSTARPA
jgi:hypothetical protein